MKAQQNVKSLKNMGEKKGYLTPEEIMSIYPEPEKNIDEIEELLVHGITISEEKGSMASTMEKKPPSNHGRTNRSARHRDKRIRH